MVILHSIVYSLKAKYFRKRRDKLTRTEQQEMNWTETNCFVTTTLWNGSMYKLKGGLYVY